MEYIKKFVDIPELPLVIILIIQTLFQFYQDPPNFLIGTYHELLLSQLIVSHDVNPEDSLATIPRANTLDGTLVDFGPPQVHYFISISPSLSFP